MSTRRERKRWSRKKRSRGQTQLAARGGDRRIEHGGRQQGRALRLSLTAGLATIQDARDERAAVELRMVMRRADAVRRASADVLARHREREGEG